MDCKSCKAILTDIFKTDVTNLDYMENFVRFFSAVMMTLF